MNINKKRHSLLKLLSIQRNNFDLKKASNNNSAVDFKTIFKELSCNEDELQIITAELYTSDEILYHSNYGIIGLVATQKGLSAFSNEKYLNVIRKNRVENTKSFVQIVIPILALIVAILSFTEKFHSLKKQAEKDKQEVILRLEKQKVDIKKLEYRIEEILKNQKNEKKK